MSGLSGLTRTADGTLWAIGEHDHVLLAMSVDGAILFQTVIAGLDEDIDLESLTSLGDGRFAAGTERKADGRPGDVIYLIRADAERAEMTGEIELGYALWGLASRGNQGIEGLCAAGESLLAAIETPMSVDGERVAAIGRYDMVRERWTAMTLRLTSGTGKISALDCRPAGDQIDVIAIERHFEISRVLRFAVPATATATAAIEPTVVLDLAPFKRRADNFEGIAWLSDRAIAIVVDNNYGTISGPNTLVRVDLQSTPGWQM